MLLVNTKATYPEAARRVLAGDGDDASLAHLELITRGDWPNLTDVVLSGSADYVAGTCEGVVTAVYRVLGWGRFSNSEGVPKIEFIVEPADELVGLIGQSQPEGPWRRGESRGTRRVETSSVLKRFGSDSGRSWSEAVIEVARAVLGVPGPGAIAGPSLTIRPDGTVVVTVDAGVSVLVVSRSS